MLQDACEVARVSSLHQAANLCLSVAGFENSDSEQCASCGDAGFIVIIGMTPLVNPEPVGRALGIQHATDTDEAVVAACLGLGYLVGRIACELLVPGNSTSSEGDRITQSGLHRKHF